MGCFGVGTAEAQGEGEGKGDGGGGQLWSPSTGELRIGDVATVV